MGALQSRKSTHQVRKINGVLSHSTLLSNSETSDFATVCGELGPDPTSDSFACRTKSIAFVFRRNGFWFQIKQNFFNQALFYNEFSGGYKRLYRELPYEFIHSTVTRKILNSFQQKFDIPDNEFILVQVQTTHLQVGNENESITGQGIHTDGADYAMLLCLKRENVAWARNMFFRDPDGKQSICQPFVLQPGEACYWADNQIYHYVEPGEAVDGSKKGERTVLIAHYPAMHYITGGTNPNNKLQ